MFVQKLFILNFQRKIFISFKITKNLTITENKNIAMSRFFPLSNFFFFISNLDGIILTLYNTMTFLGNQEIFISENSVCNKTNAVWINITYMALSKLYLTILCKIKVKCP